MENVVDAQLDAQLDGIERLLSASVAEDWPTVKHISKYLAMLTPDEQNEHVVDAARHVCDELDKHQVAPQTTPKQLGKLLAACRAVSKFWSTS